MSDPNPEHDLERLRADVESYERILRSMEADAGFDAGVIAYLEGVLATRQEALARLERRAAE